MNIVIAAKSTLTHGLGGMETHLDGLCRALTARGHGVDVVTTRHPSGRAIEDLSGARYHYLADAPPRRYSAAWWSASRRALAALLRERRIDVVLSESLAGAAMAGLSARPPIYPFVHGLVLSHLPVEREQVRGAAATARFLIRTLPELLYYAYAVERPFFRMADGVIATQDLLLHALRRRCRQVILAYNGVDVVQWARVAERRQRVRRMLGVRDDEPVVLLAALMTRQKGFHVGLAAFARVAARVPAARLVVVGDGPEAPRLRTQAADLGLGGRSRFVGPVDHAAMPGYFDAADVYVHPSLRAEGLPTAVLEGMAAGVPIVATDVGGSAAAITDGVTGLLVPRNDASGLAMAVVRLLMDRALASALARQALERARARFAWPSIVDGLLRDLGRGAPPAAFPNAPPAPTGVAPASPGFGRERP